MRKLPTTGSMQTRLWVIYTSIHKFRNRDTTVGYAHVTHLEENALTDTSVPCEHSQDCVLKRRKWTAPEQKLHLEKLIL